MRGRQMEREAIKGNEDGSFELSKNGTWKR